MSCQRLQAYFEEHEGCVSPWIADAELLEHAANCSSCREFAQSQDEVAAGLNLVRKSAPAVRQALDAAVLAAYHREVALARASATAPPAHAQSGWVGLRWVAAAAFCIVLVAALLFRTSHSTKSGPEAQARPLVVASPPKPAAPDVAAPPRVQRKKSATFSTNPIRAAVAASDPHSNSLPSGFRSLMYCDEISCSGGMEVVRIQLPSPGVALTQASAQSGSVSADVLVGEDGLARAIRIVE